MITTLEQAQAELRHMSDDAVADIDPEEPEHRDLVVSLVYSIESDEIARELCRVELGYVPFEHEARLGKRDWIDA